MITHPTIIRVHLSAVYYVELFQITDQMSLVNNVLSVKCVDPICPGYLIWETVGNLSKFSTVESLTDNIFAQLKN